MVWDEVGEKCRELWHGLFLILKKIALVDWCGLSWRGTSLEAGRPDCRLP